MNTTKVALGGLAALVVAGALAVGVKTQTDLFSAAAAPDPLTCTGYPEPRTYLENQSWWEPQLEAPDDPDHPGTGKQGHIHVGGCFPLYQQLPGDTLHFDVRIQLHNMTGTMVSLRMDAYGDHAYEVRPRTIWNGGQSDTTFWRCEVADCDRWVGINFPLNSVHWKGLHEFNVMAFVYAPGGVKHQYTVSRWHAYVDRPSLPDAPPGSTTAATQANAWIGVGGDSWYTTGGAKYARVGMVRADVPWDEATGKLKPLSGTWTPTVHFEKKQNFAYVDPAFHAVPPSKGTIVWEQTTTNTGYLTKTLSIDTTKLADGEHRLVFGTGNITPEGTNSGLGVIRFLVNNGCVT